MKQQAKRERGSTSHHKVFALLEEAILSGEYKPGDPLIEMKLSLEMGVSRTPVREAIRQLELEGLVRTVPNCGAVVVGVSEKDIEDIYTIRSLVEGLAARWAAARITQSEREDLKLIVELQEFYLEKRDVSQVLQLDTRFHEIVNSACRSNIIDNTLTSFHHRIKRARRVSFEHRERALVSVAEHRSICEAIARGDEAAAERCMTEHILNAKEAVKASLGDSPAGD